MFGRHDAEIHCKETPCPEDGTDIAQAFLESTVNSGKQPSQRNSSSGRPASRSNPGEDAPANFHKLLAATTLSKCGDQLTKPGLILTWILMSLDAPAAAIGALAPMREAGSLLPQIAIGESVSKRPIRKYCWSLGAALQGICVLAMAGATLKWNRAAAGWTVVALLAIFSVARGICSVTSKDLLGRTIPKGLRGRLSGIAGSMSGLTSVGIALMFLVVDDSHLPESIFTWLLGTAAAAWLTAAATMTTLRESPAKLPSNPDDGLRFHTLRSLLSENAPFRNYCISRALLAGTVLSLPFYVVLAHEATDGNLANLGALMLVGGAATTLSSALWGRFADKDSRQTLGMAGLCAGVIGCLTAATPQFDLSPTAATWVYSALFFLIGTAHTGIRLGRKTYLVDMAKEQNRARLVAVSNTLIGVIVLGGGAFGFLGDWIGTSGVVLVFALLGGVGGAMALRLPLADNAIM